MAMGSQDKHQVEKNRHFIQALGHAWDGVKDVVKKERNMRFHIVATILVIIVAFWLQVNVFEWLWLLSAIFVVFAAEFANTIVEELVDLVVHHHYDLDAKYAKDIAAGVVLLAAFYAVLVGLFIFWPKLRALFGI